MRTPVLALCITGAISIVSVDAFAQRQLSADVASPTAALEPYIGKTCSVTLTNNAQNSDQIFEKGGRLFVHHRYYEWYTWHDAGVLLLARGTGGWAATFVSDSGAEESYNPGQDAQHLRVRISVVRGGPYGMPHESTYVYSCVPTKP